MIYGCQIGAVFTDMTLEEGLRAYRRLSEELGLESVELDFSHPDLFTDGLRPRVLPWEVRGRVRSMLEEFVAEYQVKSAHLPFSSMGVYSVSPNPRVERASRERIKEAIAVCAELGLDAVTMHLDGYLPNAGYEATLERCREALEEYLDVAKSLGIVVAVENTGMDMPYLPDLVKVIRDLRDRHIMMTFDIGHAYPRIRATPYRTLEEFLRREADIIKTLHVHDHNMVRDHLPVGEGVIDFEAVIGVLMSHGFAGALNLEIIARSVDDIVRSVSLLRSYERC